MTSFVMMDEGSRVQLSQIPQVVREPEVAEERAEGWSHAAVERWLLAEKYCFGSVSRIYPTLNSP